MEKQIKIFLEDILKERGITRYELAKRTDTLYPIIDKYYKNKVVRFDREVLLRFCLALDCEIEDIIKIVTIEK